MTVYQPPLLRYGSRGEPVRQLQSSLNQLKPTALAPLDADGIFGLLTLGRVTEFQRSNELVGDGIVGPMTWGEIETLLTALAKHDPFSQPYRLPKPVPLKVAAIYLPTMRKDDIATSQFPAASKFLKKYNLFLDVWPTGGKRTAQNTLNKAVYNSPIPNQKNAYVQLRKDVDHLIYNKMNRGRDRGPLPVVFCDFKKSGAHGITPHSTARFPHASPACLIRISAKSVADKLCIAHEMGHSALYPLAKHDHHQGNLMHVVSGRTYLFRFQVEAFARATYARAGK